MNPKHWKCIFFKEQEWQEPISEVPKKKSEKNQFYASFLSCSNLSHNPSINFRQWLLRNPNRFIVGMGQMEQSTNSVTSILYFEAIEMGRRCSKQPNFLFKDISLLLHSQHNCIKKTAPSISIIVAWTLFCLFPPPARNPALVTLLKWTKCTWK